MTPRLDELVLALLALETPQEARMFLRDLLTEKELSEFSKRWQAAQMLADAVPYSQIVQTTGLSSTTIARISHWLAQGTGGYQLMLERVRQRGVASSKDDTLNDNATKDTREEILPKSLSTRHHRPLKS